MGYLDLFDLLSLPDGKMKSENLTQKRTYKVGFMAFYNCKTRW